VTAPASDLLLELSRLTIAVFLLASEYVRPMDRTVSRRCRRLSPVHRRSRFALDCWRRRYWERSFCSGRDRGCCHGLAGAPAAHDSVGFSTMFSLVLVRHSGDRSQLAPYTRYPSAAVFLIRHFLERVVGPNRLTRLACWTCRGDGFSGLGWHLAGLMQLRSSCREFGSRRGLCPSIRAWDSRSLRTVCGMPIDRFKKASS